MRQWTISKEGETGFVVSEGLGGEERFLVSTIASAQSPEALAMLLPAMRDVFMHNICRWREYSLAPVLRAMIRDCKGRTRRLEPNDVDLANLQMFLEEWGVMYLNINEFSRGFGEWLVGVCKKECHGGFAFPEDATWFDYTFKDTTGAMQKIFVEIFCYCSQEAPGLRFGEVLLHPCVYGHERELKDEAIVVVALPLNEKGEIYDI